MSIKRFLARLVEKITGKKCSRCWHNVNGSCCHPDGNMFMRCWHGITRPGFAETPTAQTCTCLTPEELHQLGKIVESLKEASATARDGGLLEDALDGDCCPLTDSEG